tara:strand:+ start:139 stop:555 length:417 start_codon:yes stop_codon:yes gene_type:complete
MTTRRVPGGTRSLTGILDKVDPLIDRIRGRVQLIVDDTTGQIARNARAVAPVRSGALRDGLVDRAEPGPPDQIRRSVGVTGPAGAYARFVISSKIGERKHATRARYFYTRDLGDPVRASRQPMAAAIVAAAIQEVDNG